MCMLNGLAGGKSYPGESDTVADDVRKLRSQLLKLPRPFLMIGGSARVWRYPSEWGTLVSRLSEIGIPVIDGEEYLLTFEKGEDGDT